ncbi:MAG: short-chain fatty acid transporter [Salinisphaeraceae bacterium]|nr:short-chain fatty acid transporter [Salinisphaeraceae bacterium]
MLRFVAGRFKWAVDRFLPDAFVFTAILTLVTVLLGLTVAGQGPVQMMEYWYDGFWKFLTFTMQMVLVLLTGYCLAMAPAVQAGLGRIAAWPRTPAAAVTLVILVSGGAAFISWGVGLVLGPLFAREVAKRQAVDYPILIAAAFCGAICALPAGLTITAPVLVNTPGHFLEAEIGLIPQTLTIFSAPMLIAASAGVAAMVFIFRRMLPPPSEAIIVSRETLDAADEATVSPGADADASVAQRLSDSRLLTALVAGSGLIWAGIWFYRNGFDLNLDILNFSFLMLGIALHGSLRRYGEAFTQGSRAASQIILQYPFYAGIMGMMAGSGLISMIATGLAATATTATFGLFTMFSAGLINIFVPSAGGQWVIQGPILVETARQLGVPPAVAVNAFTIGDLWTNMFQPFLALPALGISGLGLRDIWGYCLVALIVFGLIGALVCLAMPLLV